VFLQYILRNYVHTSKEPALFFEMEMNRFNVYQRSAQIAEKYNFNEFTSYAGSDSQTDREIVSAGIKRDHEKLYLCDKSGLIIDEIRNTVVETQINIGRKIKVIGIDYIQLMEGPGKSKYEMVDQIAKTLKNLAKDLDLVVFSVSQVTGLESRYDRIKLGMVRDSKTIEHASDYVLTLRMKTNTEDNQIIEIIKNRGGRCHEFLIPIDPERLQYDFDSMVEYKSNVI
jgi:replicative DNA helicase